MILREELEQREYKILADRATKSAESKGRMQDELKCDFRTEFQRDRDRIIHSKAFRRLMHKTQVFLAPEGDHFRTRLTHTLEVSQIARTIARSLRLNEDLTEAIAMGHDLGHTPFGHNGEEYLNQRHADGFKHNVQGLRVVDVLENRGGKAGMNLTAEVRDGILNHTGEGVPFTPEGKIVRFSDRIAYINHDIDDALRSGVICEADLPADCIKALGSDHRSRINNLVSDVVMSSDKSDDIVMSEERLFYMNKLRDFMFENVYHSKKVKKDEELDKIKHMIFSLYDYYESNPDKLPDEWKCRIPQYGVQEVVKDHIAGMTDRYAVNLFKEIFVPQSWK
jgi:dGTPase